MSNHLISLELQGYKTFASKTEFKFPAQLTAIVGPNGSGKSNIADAIRWVLGEQAYSLLRGKKTIDMIFSGSEQRPRSSMASASITFDNQSGWLPVDFSEVNLTRRAYRNGENEYLINNQRVRLKEINELLASSGLAERNYTIIGQGLVDTALSLKPEDRRRFFEEAAGIGLYRSRRAEANQKLDKTLRNVERINDILTELKPRIRSLEKQQEKSISYLQIDADLKLLLKDWYGFHWHQTQDSLRQAISVNAQQQENVNAAREIKQNLEKKLDLAQTNLQVKRARLSELHSTLAKLYAEKEENARQLAVLEERANSQKSRLAEMEKNQKIDQDRRISLSEEIKEGFSQLELDQKELKEMEADLKAAQEKLDSRLSQRTEKNTQIYQYENEINHSTQEILRLRTLIEGLQHQIELRESDLQKLKVVNKNNQNLFEKCKDVLSERRKDEESINQKISAQKEKIATFESSSKKLYEQIRELHSKKNNLENLLRKLNSQVQLIEEAETALAGFSSGAKTVIDAARNGKLSIRHQVLMDHIEVAEEYEIPIASALGAFVEGVLLDAESELKNVIDYVESENASRVILIDTNNAEMKKGSYSAPENFIHAIDVVSCEEGYAGVIANLLSTTYIAEDLEKAQQEVKNLPHGFHIVTMNGELFSSNHTILVGKESRTKSFSRKREKNLLVPEIKETMHALAEVESKLILAAREDSDLKNDFESLKSELRQNENVLNNITLEVHKLEIEYDQRVQQLENEKNRISEFLNSGDKEKENISQLNRKIEELDNKISEKKKITEMLYAEIQTLPVEELRAAVMDINSQVAVAGKLVENNQKRLGEKQSQLDAYGETAEENLKRALEIQESQQTVDVQSSEIKERDILLNRQIKTLTEESNPLESTVEKDITDQSKFLEEVDNARRKFAIAERHKLQAQMKVENLREKIERYQKKIGEDFGIFIEDSDTIYGPKPLPISSIIAEFPRLDTLPENLSEQISQKKALLRRLGPINPNALEEYNEVNGRFLFLSEQLMDLDKAEKDLHKIVDELDGLMKKEFMKTFRKVAVEFENIFTQLFNGGKAKLVVEDEENILDSGIDIEATLPGRRKQELALLSGGERSLTAVALIFALLKISPTPFCILDEIDAMLDESNVMRVGELLKELSQSTQFIIITHNRNTVQLADIIYGITMGKDSVSQMISLKLDELTDEMVH